MKDKVASGYSDNVNGGKEIWKEKKKRSNRKRRKRKSGRRKRREEEKEIEGRNKERNEKEYAILKIHVPTALPKIT